jgi:hypothetical protein
MRLTRSMQDEFKTLTKTCGLWSSNAAVATHQELSGLFENRGIPAPVTIAT